jgi:glutathione S-transferase
VIELHQFRRAWGLNPSPFCLKVETYCQLAGLPYKAVPTLPARAPRGKLPFIVADGKRLADSGHILAFLRAQADRDLDVGLDARQQAMGHLLRRMCEESLYFVLVYSRWIDDAGWAVAGPEFFRGLPPVIRSLLPAQIRRKVRGQLHQQGYGRHSRDEIYALGAADLAALAAFLGDHAFAVADRPTSYDATVYALMKSILAPPLDSPLKRAAMALPVLAEYVLRVERAIAARTAR